MTAARHGGSDPDPARTAAARRQGRVFALGVSATAGVMLVAAGFTWASQSGDGERTSTLTASPKASTAAAASAKVGECGIVVDGTPRALPLPAARRMTMVAAVGQQVRAPDVQTARAIDAALARPAATQPKVTDALDLLARDYPDRANPDTAAQLRALSTPGGLTCAFPEPKVKKEKAGSGGLTPRAGSLRTSLLDAFGRLSTSGYDRPGLSDPKPADAAAAAGRAFDVGFAPVTDAARTRGWLLAHWLVAWGGHHHVASVTYDGWRWTPTTGAGWRRLPAPLALPPAPPPAEGTLGPATAPPTPPPPTAAEVARSVAARYLDRLHVTVATGR